MRPDQKTLFSSIDPQPPAPGACAESAPEAPTEDSGDDPIRPESIVGDHFFWASGSVLLDLS